jgi:2-polyprenyl-6-methoxyphenol hydroxylase-like FAD-dependent oxidoreductase
VRLQDVTQFAARWLQVGVLIVGAGPTGLGAATRLHQHGVHNWLLLDEVNHTTWQEGLPPALPLWRQARIASLARQTCMGCQS